MSRLDLSRTDRETLKAKGRQHGADLADLACAAVQGGVTEAFVDQIGAMNLRDVDHVCAGLRSEGFKPALVRKYERAAIAGYRDRISQHLATVRLAPVPATAH